MICIKKYLFKLYIILGFFSYSQAISQNSVVLDYIKLLEIEHIEPGIDFVDCVYVINLDERIEKWERTNEQLLKLGISGQRVSAVNGWILSNKEMKELFRPYPICLSKGHVGCLLSHLSIYADAIKTGYKRIWVLEDDVEFLEDVSKLGILLDDLEKIDSEWDVFYTDQDFRDIDKSYLRSVASRFRPDYPHKETSYYINRQKVSEGILRLGQRFGTRSMIVSQKGMRTVLEFYKKYPIWNPIDVDIHYIEGIREYCSIEDIVTNRRLRNYSDTSTSSKLNKENKTRHLVE